MKGPVVFLLALCFIGTQAAVGDIAISGVPSTTCSGDGDCISNSKCIRENPCGIGTCTCNSGYAPWTAVDTAADTYDGGCMLIGLIGDSCGSDGTGGCPGNSDCDATTDRCVCPSGLTESSDKLWCEGAVVLNGDCSTSNSDMECKVYNDYFKANFDHPVYGDSIGVFVEQLCTGGTCECNSGAGYFEESGACVKKVANAGETCDTVANGGPICEPSTQTTTQGFGGLICNSGTCECSEATTAERAYLYMGLDMNICAHASAEFNLGEDRQCRVESTNPQLNKYCISNLECDDCPEDPLNVPRCKSGAVGLVGSILLVITALCLTKYF